MSTPQLNQVKDSHYVARFLTQGWRTESGLLRYYDFNTGRCETKSDKELFVANTPWGNKVEAWLNQNIEKPVSRFIYRRWRLEDCNPKTKRALIALLLLQPVRTVEDGSFLNQLALGSPNTLDGLVAQFMNEHDVYIRHHGNGDYWLNFPSDGYSIFPTPLGCGYFLIISPRCTLFALPKGTPWSNPPSSLLGALSVGWSSPRVVIPPPNLWSPDLVALAQHMEEMRQNSKEMVRLVLEMGRIADLTDQVLS